MNGDTLQLLASFVGDALRPFLSSLGTDEEFLAYAEELGWSLPVAPPSVLALSGSGNAVIDALADAEIAANAVSDGTGDDGAVSQALARLVAALGVFAFEVRELPAKLSNELPAVFVDVTNFADVFGARLFEDLIVRAIAERAPLGTAVAGLAGLVEEMDVEEDPALFRPAHIRRTLHPERIGPLLTDQASLLEDIYGWGTTELDIGRLFVNLQSLSYAVFGPLEVRYPTDSFLAAVAPDSPSLISDGPPPAFTIPIYEGDPVSIVLAAIPLPKLTPEELQGVVITIAFHISEGTKVVISPSLTLAIDGDIDLSSDVAVVIRPDRDPEMVFDPNGSTVPLSGRGGARLTFADAEGRATRLLAFGESALEVKDIHFELGVDAASGAPDLYFGIGVTEGVLVISAGESDSFIKAIFPNEPLELNFDLGLTWSYRNGVRFNGTAGFSTDIPLHRTFGPLSVESAHIELLTESGDLSLELSVNGRASIGPAVFSIERIGLKAVTSFRDGNLGPFNLDAKFKPPNGVGIAIDAGGFKGGGFLSFDREKGEYVGALELDFKGKFALKAIGIISTKLPDGSKGFSLLIIIAAEFTPIQLGYGFTLNGVGGILGLNRSIDVNALADGIRTNAIKSILFPEDVVANITRIVSDIKKFFPQQPGHFVIGPMGKLGWGTPPIVTLELGILLDLPNPMIAIVGVLKAALPEGETTILRLQANFIGILDFDRGYTFFRSDLYESRLLAYTITGTTACLASWGEAKTGAMSVGGFHPDFRDIPSIPALPDGFRNMARIGLSLLTDDNPRLKVESYFAITSNTAQFGARVELYASAAGFNIYGFVSFDVLFQFDPFKFIAKLEGGVALRRNTSTIASINVVATFTGTSPFEVQGKASLSFLFFSVSVPFHHKWGNPLALIPDMIVNLLELLQDELKDTRNWIAELPQNSHLRVTLREIKPSTDGSLVIHPAGVLTFSQKSLPLEGFEIQKFGNKKPLGENKFRITSLNLPGDNNSSDFEVVREQFAPANFTKLSDSEKLSRPSFESMPSGFRLTATNDLVVSRPVTRGVDYEVSYLPKRESAPSGNFPLVALYYDRMVKGSSVRKSSISHQQSRVSMNAPKEVILPGEGYVITTTSDLKPFGEPGQGEMRFATMAEADQRQREILGQDPNLAGQIQIVSSFEVNRN